MMSFPSPIDLERIQRRTAIGATTPSALRNIVGAGSVHNIGKKLGKLQLSRLASIENELSFVAWLDEETESLRKLLKLLPNQIEPSWGAARKCVNIFLLECLLNRFLHEKYKDSLDRITPWLEIPLDGQVGEQLKKEDPTLPSWKTVKRLEPEESKLFQASASKQAKRRGIARVYLELELWRAE
jgi:hypothetical protein